SSSHEIIPEVLPRLRCWCDQLSHVEPHSSSRGPPFLWRTLISGLGLNIQDCVRLETLGGFQPSLQRNRCLMRDVVLNAHTARVTRLVGKRERSWAKPPDPVCSTNLTKATGVTSPIDDLYENGHLSTCGARGFRLRGLSRWYKAQGTSVA